MDSCAADWVFAEVLTAFYLTSVGGRLAVRQCLCQIGVCGPCSGGNHEFCTPRLPHWQRHSWPMTEVIGSRHGAGRMPVLQHAERPCRWRCPCECAAAGSPMPVEPVFEQLDLFGLVTA
jgi:hypothetical protein